MSDFTDIDNDFRSILIPNTKIAIIDTKTSDCGTISHCSITKAKICKDYSVSKIDMLDFNISDEKDACIKIADFVENCIVMGYNIGNGVQLISEMMERVNYGFDFGDYYDIVPMIKRCYPELQYADENRLTARVSKTILGNKYRDHLTDTDIIMLIFVELINHVKAGGKRNAVNQEKFF